MNEQDKALIEDLRYIARYPHNYHASYICRKAADRMEELAAQEPTDPGGPWIMIFGNLVRRRLITKVLVKKDFAWKGSKLIHKMFVKYSDGSEGGYETEDFAEIEDVLKRLQGGKTE